MRKWAALLVLAASLAQAQTWSDLGTPPERVDTPTLPAIPTLPQNNQSSGWSFISEAWSWTGNLLAQACNVVNGQEFDVSQFLGLDFPVRIPVSVRYQPELSWLCEASDLWKYINGLVGQDWAQFAADIGGRWIGDVVTGVLTSFGIEMGSQRWASDIANFRDTLRRGYTEFVKALRNYVWNGIQADLNRMRAEKYGKPLPPNDGSAHNYFERVLAFFRSLVPDVAATGVEKGNNLQETAEQAENAAKVQDQAEKTEKALKEATNSLVKMRGEFDSSPTQKGLYETLMDKARSAASTREVLEVLVEAVLTTARANLYGSEAVVRNIQALTTGQALNNLLLVNSMRAAGADAADAETIIREVLEEHALDTTALQYGTKIGEEAAKALTEALGNTPDIAVLNTRF